MTQKKTGKKSAGRVPKNSKTALPKILSTQTAKRRNILSTSEKADPFLNYIYDKVDNFILKELFVDDGDEIILAVSGGVDSISLMDIMAVLSDKYLFNIQIAHYNHNLRGASSHKDEEFVRETAKKYSIPFHCSKGKVRQYARKKSLSVEHAARILRYMFLERVARTVNSKFVATAHNSDDSVETFLLNLLRGSGLDGLSGIPVQRSLAKGITVFRPLLSLTKSELIEYATKRKLEWREDESNNLMNFTRNRIRHDLIPKLKEEYNPSVVNIIDRTARLMRGANEYINEIVSSALPTIIHSKTSEQFSLKIPLLQTFNDFLQGELIQSSLQRQFQMMSVSLRIIDNIIELEDKETGSQININEFISVFKDRNSLIFLRKQDPIDFENPISKTGEFSIGKFTLSLCEVTKRSVKYSDDSNIEFLDYDLVPIRLFLRSWQSGDKFTPLGLNGKMKISDFLINEKIPLSNKSKVILLASKNDVIWICGMRISDKFKVSDQTKRYLKAQISWNEDE